jgi:hypothetical protein
VHYEQTVGEWMQDPERWAKPTEALKILPMFSGRALYAFSVCPEASARPGGGFGKCVRVYRYAVSKQ